MSTSGFEPKYRLRSAFLTGACVAAVWSLPTSAWSQDNTAAADQAPVVQGDQIETVTVTARRRSEDIQSTPVAVTAVTGEQLEARAAVDITDLTAIAPSMDMHPVSGPNALAVAIRGVGFNDVEKSFDPAVGVLIDGVYLGTNTGALLHAFDFESVEILRGPQGTLFGRNTPGGVINIRRTTPTGEFGANLSATFGNYGRQDYGVVLNLPKLGDLVSTKFFYTLSKTDGYLKNVTLGHNEPGDRYQNYGVTFLITPTQDIDIRLTLEQQREKGHWASPIIAQTGMDLLCAQAPLGPGGSLIFITGIPSNECNRNSGDDLYTTFTNHENPMEYKVEAITNEINWHLGDLTLTSITGYNHSREYENLEFDGSSIDYFNVYREQPYEQFSQELRATGQITDNIDFVAGAYYFHSSYTLDMFFNYGAFFGPVFGGSPGVAPPPAEYLVNGTSTSTAAYADIDWEFVPGWRLSLGGRYTEDKKSNAELSQSVPSSGPPIPIFDTPILSHRWAAFTPKASLDWRPNENMMLYFSYAKGYRSGGYNGRAAAEYSAETPYNPETVQSFELGAKTEWLDKRLLLNADVFVSKYQNKQEEIVQATGLPPPNVQETIVANAASARIQGLELEALAIPVENLTLRGTLGLLDAEYDHFYTADPDTLEIVDVKSRLMRDAPHVTANIGFDYLIPSDFGNWMLSANYKYISRYETTIVPAVDNLFANDPRGLTDPQNNVDASLTLERDVGPGTARISVFGRNLLDDRGLAAALPVGTDGVGGLNLFTIAGARPPRTYGVSLGYKF